MLKSLVSALLYRPTSISLNFAMLTSEQRVSDDYSVYSRGTGENLVDHQLETITSGSLERNSRSVEFARGDSRSSATLDGCSFLNRLRARIDRKTHAVCCGAYKKD